MNRLKKILICAFLYTGITLQAQPPASTINSLQKAIVRVESGNRVGTGFLWKNSNWVVTTLHLIENKNNIKIKLFNDTRTAKVIKVLRDYDLVLLQLSSPSVGLTVISNTNQNPEVNTSLYTMGYNGNGNLNSIIDRTLRLGFNSNGKLEGLLPTAVKNALRQCKRPNPKIEILYLEGTLIPGFSGSPIVDNFGRLVGIADGGLEDGAHSISWGVSATRLTKLVSSTEFFPAFNTCGSSSNAVTFSSENLLESNNIEFIQFNNFKFVKTKVRSVKQMMHTIDDPNGLVQLMTSYSIVNGLDYSSFRYDIYEDLATGMSLCVPEGSKLVVKNNLIVAEYGNTGLKFLAFPSTVFINHINPVVKYQPLSNMFQSKIMSYNNLHQLVFRMEQSLSYNQPFIMPNGTLVNRIAFRGFSKSFNQFGQQVFDNFGNPVLLPQTLSFETHVGKGNSYIGMSAFSASSNQAELNSLNQCINSGQCSSFGLTSVFCEGACSRYELFSKIVIGVHMGGFSTNHF